MPTTNYQIQALAVDEDGLQIGYYQPDTDVKAHGLVRLHTLIVPRGLDYDGEIEAVLDALIYLINDVGEDWENLPGRAVEGEER